MATEILDILHTHDINGFVENICGSQGTIYLDTGYWGC